jgi:uncharacterized membrane protein YozB (DUF420 family)
MITYSDLPHLNAVLNALSAVFMVNGYRRIRHGDRQVHKTLMLGALTSSCVFLGSYLVYHAQAGSVRFQGQGWVRPLYFAILITHTVLATAVLPLVLITLRHAWRRRFDKHRRLARWTLPVWLYVSVTGVVVYVMLYRLSW